VKSIRRIFCPAGAASIPEHSVSDMWLADTQECIFLRELRLSPVSITPLMLHKNFIHLIPTLYIFSPMAQQPLVGQGHLIVEASQSHSDTPHSVGLLWASYQSVTETSDITQHSQQRDIHGPGEVRTRNPNKRVAADPLLRPRDRRCMNLPIGSIVK
jgi:hypothetical protein